MSLLLDALNRASKEKAAAAATSAAACAPAVSEVAPPELTDRTQERTPSDEAPLPAWPNLELSPAPTVAEAPPPAVVQPLELQPVPVPARAAPEQPLELEPAPTQSPAPAPVQTPAPTPAATPMSRPAAGFDASRVAQDILRAKAPRSGARASKRLMILGGAAVLLALALASVLFGWWGDPAAWLQSDLRAPSLVPNTMVATPTPTPTASASAPAPAPAVLAQAGPPLAVSTEPPLSAPAPGQTPPPVAEPLPPVTATRPNAVSAVPLERPADCVSGSVSPHCKAAKKVEAPADSRPLAAQIRHRSTGPSALELGFAALTEGRMDEAAQAYTQALRGNPQERDALLGLAYIAHQQGRMDDASAYYRRVLRQEPGNPVARAGLLALNPQESGPDLASRAREVAEQNPKSAAAQSVLGHSLVRENRMGEARQAFQRAHLLEPLVPGHAFNLAVAFDRMHDYASARHYYELALAHQAGAEPASSVPQAAVQARLAQLRSQVVAEKPDPQ